MNLNGHASDLIGRCPALTFHVKDSVVRTNGQTTFTDGQCGDLRENDKVKVHGEAQPDGSVLAGVVDFKPSK